MNYLRSVLLLLVQHTKKVEKSWKISCFQVPGNVVEWRKTEERGRGMELAIQERLKDQCVEHGLTLGQFAKQLRPETQSPTRDKEKVI